MRGDPSAPDAPSLPVTLEEVEQIETLAAGCEVHLMTGAEATVANTIVALRRGDIDVLHFAGHAWFDGSERHLAFADGQFRAAEFRSLISARLIDLETQLDRLKLRENVDQSALALFALAKRFALARVRVMPGAHVGLH